MAKPRRQVFVIGQFRGRESRRFAGHQRWEPSRKANPATISFDDEGGTERHADWTAWIA